MFLSISAFLLLSMGLRIGYSRYHYHLKVWLYSKGITWLKKNTDQDIGKVHDAFVSAADEEFLLVKNFIIPGETAIFNPLTV